MAEMSSAQLSVVIPVYGCRECLEILTQRIRAAVEPVCKSFEIVFVDDASPDNAWEKLVELCRRDPAVKGLRLSRNFGQHAAITAGLAHALGQWAVVMDCDLQDPPEDIPRLLERGRAGFDVVFARRIEKRLSLFRRVMSRLFFRLINFLNGSRLDGEFGSFSLISRKVIDAYLQVQDRDRHYLFILHWLGFRSCVVDYEHGNRYAGVSAYDWRRLVRHAINGFFFQTTSILRGIVYLGFLTAGIGTALALYFVYRFLFESVYPGWTSLAVLILVVGGFIIISTGIAGLYIGKIFEQAKGRPLFVVDARIGGKAET
jgi:dolichol-phosphate mannosyltransferase